MMMLHDDDEDDELHINTDVTNTNELKKKCFNILPSLFRKKYPKYKGNPHYGPDGSFRKHYSFEVLNQDKLSSSFPITDSCLIPGSPISPRVKNFNLDMKVLVLSRKDNPYLSRQIERSNSVSSDYTNDYPLSTPILAIRKNSHHCYYSSKQSVISDNIFTICQDDNSNLHDKLIRSPPPNFPEKLSHFLFNEGNSVDQLKGNEEEEEDESFGH